MPARLRRPAILSIVALALIAVLAPAPAAATSTYTIDLYFSAGYERQIDNRTCTAASTAMMENFIARRDLNLSQRTILRYEQPRDALNDLVQRGSDPLGWSRAASYFSAYTTRPSTYRWEAYTSKGVALTRAARQLAATHKPVGLLVRHGTHAVVMTGFVATRNPNRGDFSLLYVYLSDPYGSRHYVVAPAISPLDRYYQLDATPTYDQLWYGKHIIIAPQY